MDDHDWRREVWMIMTEDVRCSFTSQFVILQSFGEESEAVTRDSILRMRGKKDGNDEE